MGGRRHINKLIYTMYYHEYRMGESSIDKATNNSVCPNTKYERCRKMHTDTKTRFLILTLKNFSRQ